MIDLDAVLALRAVSTHGSVGAAASALGFTPSAVSQQVKRLERSTGVPLLERVGRGVILTRHGRHLVESSTPLLAGLEELESGLHRQAQTVAGRLRVATFSTAMRGLVAPVVRDVLDAHPDLSVTLSEREPWDAVELVATDRADLAVVHRWGDVPLSVPDHVVLTPLADDLADVILHREHPLAGRDRLSPAELVAEGWIATPPSSICRQWLERMYVGTGHPPRVVHESWEFDSHLAMARARLGIALIPRLGRSPLAPDLCAVPLHDPVPLRRVLAAHRRSMTDSPALTTVLEALVAAH
ncbi:LysR family transcriptional regulator [Nocardioides sp. zg-DK7169]|uniref:LysR family transcriptional regulator n=1 Tax=Nocardioides sp. zg-DK7169 TaxID=2736600 RepID=UPI001554523B|nr:LysR family transcriptional regulator [Nocardioides sp. zg-DK7169]NPC98412.1 LysR family transcriptional regulator [Nocardioides sp. zg-DK7169]